MTGPGLALSSKCAKVIQKNDGKFVVGNHKFVVRWPLTTNLWSRTTDLWSRTTTLWSATTNLCHKKHKFVLFVKIKSRKAASAIAKDW